MKKILSSRSILISITTMSMIFFLCVLSYILVYTKDNIYSYIQSLDIEAISTAINSIDDTPLSIYLKHNDKTYVIDNNDIVINSAIHTILDMAYNHKMNTSTHTDTKNYVNTLSTLKHTPESILNHIFVGFNTKIDAIIRDIEYEPTDSTITFDTKSKKLFTITDSSDGIMVDRTQLYDKILSCLQESPTFTIDIPTTSIKPTISREYNESLTHKVASYTTSVSDSTGGRKTNVKLALSRVNGMVVKPGETVSFNKITGPHTAECGYQPATVILNGEYVEDIGGGICQASSTLYNALLLTGTKILEVAKHSIPVKYVPLSLDAMVSEGIADLKWTNTLSYPMYIHTHFTTESVTVDIYSKSLGDISYKAVSETIKTLDFGKDTIIEDTDRKYTSHVLYKGEYYRIKYPRNGYEAIGYLEKYDKGALVSREKIRHEIYKPQSGVIVEGIIEPVEGMKIENYEKLYL